MSTVKRTPLKRSSGLKRTGGLKRTQMARKPSPRKDNSFPSDSDPQLRCRGCERRGIHQHHVVRAQDVEKSKGDTKDRRNALRVCWDCHEAHHGRADGKLKTNVLRDENIEFAFELLGPWAATYIRGKYDDVSEPDPRIERELARTLEAA